MDYAPTQSDVQAVLDLLALPGVCGPAVEQLLCTWNPNDITTEQVEAMMEIM